MNPRLRVALALTPLLSLGLLSWLPFLYFHLARLPGPLHLRNTIMVGVSTLVTVPALCLSGEGGALRLLLTVLWVWLVAVSTIMVWVCTSARSLAPEPDPYA